MRGSCLCGAIRWHAAGGFALASHFTQCFCGACGGKLPRVDPSRGIAVVPMGALDDDPGIRPREHIFVASKAAWDEIADGLPQHAEMPPA